MQKVQSARIISEYQSKKSISVPQAQYMPQA